MFMSFEIKSHLVLFVKVRPKKLMFLFDCTNDSIILDMVVVLPVPGEANVKMTLGGLGS